MRKLSLFATVIMAFCGAADAAPAMTGSWNMVSSGQNGQKMTEGLNLTEKNGVLSGTVHFATGTVQISNIKIQGNTLSYDFVLASTGQVHVTLQLQEDSLTGTFSTSQGGHGTITGMRGQ